MTLDEIQAEVLRATGFRFIGNFLESAVREIEDGLLNGLRLPLQRTAAIVTLTNGEGALPADFYAVSGVVVNDRILPQISAEDYFTDKEGFHIDGNTIKVNPATLPEVRLVYYKRLPSALNGSNVVLERFPQVYRLALMAKAYEQLGRGQEAQQLWMLAGEEALRLRHQLLVQEGVGAQWRYGGTVL